jgi:hypothetical protein
VVPAEAVAGDAVQVVDNGRVERVPVSIGIRGSRNVEIISGVLRGMAVLSPARTDLADGTRVRIDNSLSKPAAETPSVPDIAPDQDPTAAPGAFVATDPDSTVMSAAISAHIDSVVNDARRNAAKYSANR